MTIYRKTLGTLALSTLLAAGAIGPVAAQDINAVAARLKAVLETNGMIAEWASVTGDASEMILDGVTISVPGDPKKVPVGKVTLTDITDDNGGFNIGGLALQDYSLTEDGVTMDINGIEMADLKLPAEGATDAVSSLMLYSTLDIANVSFKMADKDAFKMTAVHFELDAPKDGSPMTFTGTTEGFDADLSLIDDPQSKPVIEALGYNQISGSFELEGSWQPTDGRFALTQYDMTVDNAGTFGITMDLGGYTPAFIKQIQDMQKQMLAQPDGADSSAQGLAMLGMLQQLTFHGMSLRWDDDSLTNKALEFIGKQQGMSAADVANQGKAIVPFLLAQLNNPELTAQVSAAVNTYLDDPKSIEIAAKPAEAVPFALIMAGAMSGTPQDLLKTLAVGVTANQ